MNDNQRQFGWGLPILVSLALWVVILLMGHAALAQTPAPVTPGYQICSNASGVTKCSFQPVGTDNVLGLHGLPIAAVGVASCGGEALTAGVLYVPRIDLTGTLCTAGGGGGGTSNITQWGSATLGAATAWGIAPTGNVPGVNANNFATQGLTSGAMQLDAFGNLQVGGTPFPQFSDLFSAALDTTTNWTTNNSGGTTATSAGSLVVSGTTTASQYGGLSTKSPYTAAGVGTTGFAWTAYFNTLAVSNTVRCFGQYTSPATPTLAAPITDGYAFCLGATGAISAQVWSAGVMLSSTDVTAVAGCAPSTTTPVAYYAQFRINAVFFGCGINSAAAVALNVAPANQSLPLSAYSIAGLSNPGSVATMTLGGSTVVTSNPAAVKSAGQAANINDPATVTTPSPNGTQQVSQNGDFYVGTYALDSIVTPTVTASSAYASGNIVGSVMTFANAARANGGTGMLTSVVLKFQDGQTGAFDLLLFKSLPAGTYTDKTAVSLTTADNNLLVKVVHIADCTSTGTTSLCQADGLAKNYSTVSTTSLYGLLVTRATPTFTATNDIQVEIFGQKN